MKKIIQILLFLVCFFCIVNIDILCKKRRYLKDEFLEVYKMSFNDKVTGVNETKEPFSIYIDSNLTTKYRITYSKDSIPDSIFMFYYPIQFIVRGDSIIKKANNDTFFIVRDKLRFLYVLPKTTN